MTDHLILSTGTYSFFIGYLSNAQNIIYYARWPEPGSEFAKMTNQADFWLPEWIALEWKYPTSQDGAATLQYSFYPIIKIWDSYHILSVPSS